MKNLKLIITVFALTLLHVSISAQEKKIKFSKGTLRICSSKNFQITGYDGGEVIIKSLHGRTYKGNLYTTTATVSGNLTYSQGQLATVKQKKGKDKKGSVVYYFNDQNRKKGLKKLGKKNENLELGIYFTIEEKDGELIFQDNIPENGQITMFGNESYEIKIPNSLKLKWETNGCVINNKKKSQQTTLFYNSNPSSLSDFNGEVEVQSTLNNIKLTDVTGPVSINTIGGNVTIEFEDKLPQKLYSVYSNNGFIDITLPAKAGVSVDASGRDIYSDINFTVEDEKEDNDFHKMKLKLNSGKSKMKLDAGLGNIYLRKK